MLPPVSDAQNLEIFQDAVQSPRIPQYRYCAIYRIGLILTIEVLREHKPPPNVSLIELWQFFPDPDGDADRHQN